MPAAIPMHERREIVARREQGESFASIAGSLRRSYDAVRRIYHQYVANGRLTPAYERCQHTDVRHDPAIYAAAIGMKTEHRGWGAGLIVTELRERYPEEALPSVRTLQRWFRRAGVQKPRGDQKPKMKIKRGQVPHEVWALDAKEEIELADGSSVSWLTITDEGSGAMLSATLFPPPPLDDGRSAVGAASHPDHDAAVGPSGADTDG